MQDEPQEQAPLRLCPRLLQRHLERTCVWLRRENLPRRVRPVKIQVQRTPGPGGPVPGQMQE